MTLLIIGLILWIVAHMFKRLAPGPRVRLGDAGKGLVALGLLAGIVLMVIGYRGAAVIPVYAPVPGMGHLNNLLMLFALFFFVVGSMKPGVTASYVRHNMLTGTLIWALAHLLVNGDLASILLFGGMALWSVGEMYLIGRAQPWTRPARGPISRDLIAAVVALVLYGAIAWVHMLLGHNPFLGTYP